jgi:hypothetical protein
MSISAVGQITLIDYNDAVALTGYIESNRNTSVKYNTDSQAYNPNFATANLILSPHAFVAGTAGGTDLFSPVSASIKSVSWKRKTNTDTEQAALGSGETVGADHKLTVAANPFSGSIYSVTYFCTVVYTDSNSGLDTTCVMQINFQAVSEGAGSVYAEITSASGYAFKNASPASITLSANLYRGGSKDTSNLTYKWEKLVGSTWTQMGTSATQAVTPAAVSGMLLVRVAITDSVASDSYTSDPCSIIDYTDPLFVQIISSKGEVFKNGVVETTLTAYTYQNGALVTTGLTYEWSKEGDGTYSKTTQAIAVSSADVTSKAVFSCIVTKA